MTARTRIPSILAATAFAGLMLACGGDGPAAPSPNPAVAPPAIYALSGVVTERTAGGESAPVADVLIEVAVCPSNAFEYTSASTMTNAAGQYVVAGMCTGETYLWASKVGYSGDRDRSFECEGGCLVVNITGNTRLDLSLVRLP